MVLITDRATAELLRLRSEHLAQPRQGVRLTVNALDKFNMSIDGAHLGDSVFRHEHAPLLIVDGHLAARLAGHVLDFHAAQGAGLKPGFSLDRRDLAANDHERAASS